MAYLALKLQIEREFSHRIHRTPRTFCWDIFPQNSQNTQNLLLRYTHTELTEHTEPAAETYSHRTHGKDELKVL